MENTPHRRRHHLLKLRGLDPVMLEVQAQEMLRRPLSQIEPQNALDLVALHEHPSRPKNLTQALGLFVSRVEREIADIPSGKFWNEFLDEFSSVDAKHVPHTFRGWMKAESERGELRSPERVQALLAKWAEVEPELFVLGTQVTKVFVVHEPPPPPSKERTSGIRSSRERAASNPTSSSSTPARPKAVSEEDTERRQWIIEVVLERVAGSPETGLAEAILVAGVKHRAKDKYPHLLPADVTSVLRELKNGNRVRYSAGRYMPLRRY